MSDDDGNVVERGEDGGGGVVMEMHLPFLVALAADHVSHP